MEDDKKIKKKDKRAIKYNINSKYNEEGKDIKILLEEIFINYCIGEFKKVS